MIREIVIPKNFMKFEIDDGYEGVVLYNNDTMENGEIRKCSNIAILRSSKLNNNAMLFESDKGVALNKVEISNLILSDIDISNLFSDEVLKCLENV